jgi:hypothetical protein
VRWSGRNPNSAALRRAPLNAIVRVHVKQRWRAIQRALWFVLALTPTHAYSKSGPDPNALIFGAAAILVVQLGPLLWATAWCTTFRVLIYIIAMLVSWVIFALSWDHLRAPWIWGSLLLPWAAFIVFPRHTSGGEDAP